MYRVAPAAILICLIGIFLWAPIQTPSQPSPNASAAVFPLPSGITLSSFTVPQLSPLGLDDSACLAAAEAVMTKLPSPTHPTVSLKRVVGHTGFWRIAQDANNVWWFLSPAGQREFLNSVTTVQPYQLGRDSQGYISHDWTGGLSPNGNLDHWAAATLRRIHDIGFKALGAWCHPVFHHFDVPMSRDLNVWLFADGQDRRFYSPGWLAAAESAIRTQILPLSGNRNLIGYFIDNELDWSDNASGPDVYFDDLPALNPNRLQVCNVIRSVWTTPDRFNHDWGTRLTRWSDLDYLPELPLVPLAVHQTLQSAWLQHLATDYFRTTTKIIHKYDRNHLILGVRFKGDAPIEVIRASQPYTQVQSLNYYVADARLDEPLFRRLYEDSGQPILISEYSFQALDNRSGDRDSTGFLAQVPDQQARADGYRLFTTRLARVPWVIGADWFQWHDEPAAGRRQDGEDVNFGVVDVHDQTYHPLADAVRQTTPQLDPLHAASFRDPRSDVWRDRFADRPSANIPYLSHPPSLLARSGDLSDWPADSQLTGIRIAQTVGLDRYPSPQPTICLGWTQTGLYLALKVVDKDLQTIPADGPWWTRDYVEFWVCTHPVSASQEQYDSDCRQFFLVPAGPADSVGQWHRPGDSLSTNLIPDRAIHHHTSLLPDGYLTEMFIPASSLPGYDPTSRSTIAFNLHVHNSQQAVDYFWSAPKEVMTQLRPCTWGALYLAPSAPPVRELAMPTNTASVR